MGRDWNKKRKESNDIPKQKQRKSFSKMKHPKKSVDYYDSSYITTLSGIEIHSNPKIKASPAEKRIRAFLKQNNIDYIREANIGGKFRYDFLLPKLMFLIEYDGEAYHRHPNQITNDKNKTDFAVEKGFTLFRFNKKHWGNLELHLEKLIWQYVMETRYPLIKAA